MSKHDTLKVAERAAHAARPCLAICAGKHCAKAGAKQIRRAAEATLEELELEESVTVIWTKCQDYCDDAPALTILPAALPYTELTQKTVRQIVTSHLRDGLPVRELLEKKARRRLKQAEREG